MTDTGFDSPKPQQENKDAKSDLDESFNAAFVNHREKPFVLANEENIRVLINGARELLDTHPNDMVFALGRSPLWLVDTARAIEEQSGENGSRFEYIAFSGRWYEESELGYEEEELEHETSPERLVRGPVFPTQEQKNVFRKYLTKIEMDPDQVRSRMEAGQRTVIVERTHSGASLLSFLEIIREWHGFPREALDIYILKSPVMPDITKQIQLACPGVKVELHAFDHEVGRDLANSDRYHDSLGIHYPYWKWDQVTPPQLRDHTSNNADLIRQKIQQQIKSR